MRVFENDIMIGSPVEIVFDAWADFESVPKWFRDVVEVHRSGRDTARWLAVASDGERLRWESVTENFEPDKRIFWRSFRGDVYIECEAIFREEDVDKTRLRLSFCYDAPAELTAAADEIFHRSRMRANLDDFRRWIESRPASRARRDSARSIGPESDDEARRRKETSAPSPEERGKPAGEFLRRGVDRLLDRPKERWRRPL